MNAIELLGPELLEHEPALRDIDHWLAVMDRPQGWHYDLDIVWLLTQLERAGIAPGMTVLDAGAGLGITQYVLAARGFHVISLDFAERQVPERGRQIFRITQADDPPLDYRHGYADHMRFVPEPRGIFHMASKAARRFMHSPADTLNAMLDRRRGLHRARRFAEERARDHSRYGTIRFVRASFHQMPVDSASVDAVVSVSAIEHSEKDIIMRAFAEMRRVTRPGGPILVTTSMGREPVDTFHEPTRGYCFSAESLSALVGCPAPPLSYDDAERRLLASAGLWSRLDPYYYRWDWALFHDARPPRALPYLPVGLRVQ
jgi:ubiquinone/menaquinone biosynthesis C-methylase UbiE